MTVIDSPAMRVAAALADLGDCVCNELAATGAGPTCWCGLYPGATVSWEYCGECNGDRCGMGYVRLSGVSPYSTFPEPLIDFRCAYPLMWAVEVGALRCMPTPHDGESLTAVEMSEVAIGQLLDASALYRAIKCCGLDVAIESYVPLGPDGGCVGGLWRAFLAAE